MIAPQNSNNNPNAVYEPANGGNVKEKRPAATFSRTGVLKWLSLGIGITGVVAIVLSDLLVYWLTKGGREPEVFSPLRINSFVVSMIVRLVSGVIVSIRAFSQKSGLRIGGYVAYSLARGVLLSYVFLVVRLAVDSPISYIWVLSLSFLRTAAIFLVLGLIADHTAKHISRLRVFAITGSVTILTLSLINVFLQADAIYWGREIGRFLLRRIVIAIDRSNVKRLSETRRFKDNKNRAIYCAYQLYVDFIWLFLRLLLVIASSSGKKK